ncbi:unnamed protein product [Taenia asiatica]|uniref:Protein kinase domain-containing protein n=1 Tax=Taenia asiatica TaxID=60517 RepID=A0A0R3VV17_TAEAS|nr:unnamed protein product [Taenia asiatica]
MSTERPGLSASAKTPKSDGNSDHSGSSRGSLHTNNHETSKDASLSFPIKRSTAALQEPPSVFEKSPVLERSSKRPLAKQATPSPKRPRKSPANLRDARVEKAGDVVNSKKDRSDDERDGAAVINTQISPKDQRRSRKKKRRDKERKRSSKKHWGRKSNAEEDGEKGEKVVARKDRKRKVTKSPISETLVAAYSSDGDESHPPKRTSPATLPRAHAASSPVVRSERKKTLTSASPPCTTAPAPVTKVTKGTARSTWDSSDSDFEETIAKPSTPPSTIQKSTKTPESSSGVEKTQKDRSVSRKRSRSRGRSRTASSDSASSSSCSSRRSYSSRSYSSRRRSYSTSTSVSSSSRSSSRSYSRRRRSRRRGHRRHGRRHHRRSSTRSSYSRSSYSRSSSRGRGSRRRHRYSRSSGSYRRRSSYRSYSSHSRRGRYTSSERSRTPNSRDASRTPPPPVCRRTVNQRNSGAVVTAAGVVSPTETRLSRPLGNKGNFIRGHKPSEAVAAAASAAVRKITGRTEPSPPSTPPTLPKTEESEVKEESNEEEVEATKELDSNYIGPQVPPDMAKKLGLSVDSPPPSKSTNPTTPSNNNTSNNANNNNWKAHVGAKRKSERTVSEGMKKQEEIKSDFMTPPEKDDQYKALQEQAKEHVRQQMQLQANQQQQLAAAAAAVASAAAVQPATTASVAMLPTAVGHFSVIDQLRQRQQIYLLSGAMDQALALESIIRQHQQVEAATALQQQQQALQMLALQQQQQSAIIAAQQQQVQQHQVQSAQQAALLLAAQQHQAAAAAAASHSDSTGAAAAAAMIAAQQQQQQHAIIQTILQQRQQQMTPTAKCVCSSYITEILRFAFQPHILTR